MAENTNVQQKVFSRWINWRLRKVVVGQPDNLVDQLRDGTVLSMLLSAITHGVFQPATENAESIVRAVLEFLAANSDFKEAGITSSHVLNGDSSAVRNLLWHIIRLWQIKPALEHQHQLSSPVGDDAPATLLAWCRHCTSSYEGVDIHDFAASWCDGLTFNTVLHSHCPDWFDYESMSSQSSRSKLEHAFQLAYDRLNIDKLLDWQDMNIDYIDEKAVMTYIACLCDALHCRSAAAAAAAVRRQESTRSSDASVADGSPVNVASFNASLDSLLSWLGQADDTVAKQSPVASDIDSLKEQFHHHEEFMVRLTHKQTDVGSVLHDGSCLLQQTSVSDDDRRTVDSQLTLLSNRWEELRLKAMDRQARLQHILMDLQQQQLNQLSDWLNQMEARINSHPPIGGSEQQVMQQLETHRLMQAEVEQLQERVNGLHSMVVVVDENNAESAYAAMERQLEALGVRWTTVCRWMEERSSALTEAASRWRVFSERLKAFVAWLTDTQDVLGDIEKRWTLDGVTSLDDNVAEVHDVVEQVQCLKAIEGDMDVMIKYFDELNDLGSQLVQHVGGEDSTNAINSQLQNCQDRWDNLVQRMEHCSKQIANSGVELIVSTSASGLQTVTVSRSGMEAVSFAVTSPSAGDAKRARLDAIADHKMDFDRQLASLSEWLDQTEGLLELVSGDSADLQARLTVEEQLVLIEDADSDIKRHQKNVDELRVVARILLEELISVKEPTEPVEGAMKRLEARWSGVTSRVVAGRVSVTASNVIVQFSAELESLLNTIAVYNTWASSQATNVAKDFVQLSQQLEQCRVKQKSLMLHEVRELKLKEQGEELQRTNQLSAAAAERLTQLNDQWTSTNQRLKDRQSVLMKALQKTPPKSFMDAFLELTDWLANREQSLHTLTFSVNDVATMDRQISQLKEMRTELKDRAGSLEYINHAGQDLLRKASTDQSTQKLRADLENLNARWNKVLSEIEDRYTKFTGASEQQKHLRSQMDGVNNWMNEIDVFLTSEEAALGDTETLQAQLTESEGVQDDIRTMQPTVDGIVSVSAVLRSHANPLFAGRLQTDVEAMRTRWAAIIEASRQHTARLTAAVDDARATFDRVALLETWLDDVTHAHLTREYTVHSDTELQQFTTNFQTLESELKTIREKEMADIKEKINSILSAAGHGGAVELAAASTRLDSKFSDVRRQIIDNCHKFRQAGENLTSHRAIIGEETKWLDELDAKLTKGLLRASADAEELSEELDDLENFVSTHKDDAKSRITAVTQALLNDHIMVGVVTSDLDAYVARLQRSLSEAKQRIEQLEEAILQAQARETQIVEMSQWMTDVNDLLQTRLDADVLASDTPKEFESLKSEFEQHDAYMAELQKDVATFLGQGKLNAANRLENQLAILKKHYAEVTAKFIKFQKPADFDGKLAHVKHLLEDIEERLSCLEIASSEPDDIQNQLDQCMKFYKGMSEAKSEVEYVIKTGRQIVEKKQVDQPDQLNTQIDAVKLLYNELGAQVTQSKTSLEQALKLTKKLKKESASLREFVTSINKELSKREIPTAAKDIEDELVWAKSTAAEVNKKQPVLSALGDIVSQLTKMSDDHVTSTVDSVVKQLGEQLGELLEHINARKTSLHENVEHLEQMYIDFERMQREIVIWLDNAEVVLGELDQLKDDTEQSDDDINKFKKLQGEHDQLVCQVDTVRDTAIEVIAHSSRYSKTVEPQLTLLNQRWQEVTTRLKSKQNCFRDSLARHKKSSAGIAAALISVGNVNIDEMMAKLVAKMDDCRDKIDTCDLSASDEQLKSKLEELDEIESMTEKDMNVLCRHADQVIEELQKTDAVKANDCSTQTERLKERWQVLQRDFRHCRLSLCKRLYPKFAEFLQLDDDIMAALTLVEHQLAIGDKSKVTLDKEMAMVDRLNELASDMSVSYAFVQSEVSASCDTVNMRAQRLCERSAQSLPSLHVTELRMRKIRRISFVAEPTQYVRELRLLQGMVTSAEEDMNSLHVQDYKFDFLYPQDDELKLMEDALVAMQQSLESANQQRDAAVDKLSQDERVEVRQMLNSLHVRLINLQEHLEERKRSEDTLLTSMDAFSVCLEDMETWLMESESVVDQQINLADVQQISNLLTAVKERDDSLGERRQQLRVLNKSGRSMYFTSETSPEHRERISRDLTVINERWNSLVSVLPKKRQVLEEKLLALKNLENALDRLEVYIPVTKEKLHALQAKYENGQKQQKISDEDNKAVVEVLMSGQSDMATVTRVNTTMKLDAESAGGAVPQLVQRRVDDVSVNWAAIQSLAMLLQSPEASFHKQPVTETFEAVSATAVAASRTAEHDRLFTLTPSRWVELDKECATFLHTALRYASGDLCKAVVIGNVEQMESAVKSIKVQLSQLTDSYNELTDKCDRQRVQPNLSADDEHLLTARVRQISGCLDRAKAQLSRRSVELDDMTLEWRQFDETMAEFERWVGVVEEDCQSHASRAADAFTVTDVTQLVAENHRLKAEVLPWHQKVSTLRSLAERLIDGYCNDDSSKVRATVCRLDHRWTTLLHRLETLDRQLHDRKTSFSSFDADAKEFLAWLTRAEVAVSHYEEMAVTDLSASEEQQNKSQRAFNELQSEITSRRPKIESLTTTAGLMMRGVQADSEAASVLSDQLQEIKDRWNRINERVMELRAHISVLTKPSKELLQLLTELVGWLQDVNDEISGDSALAGDSATLAVQYEHSQSVRDKLEVRRSTVETSVRQGRMCRADDQSDEDIGEQNELAAAVRREADTLYKVWLGTSERVRDWQQKIVTTTKKVQSLETALKQCGEFVSALEREASTWQMIAGANLAIDQLEKEYYQTKSFHRDVKSLGKKLLQHRSTVLSLQRENISLSSKTDCFLDQLDNRVYTLGLESARRLEELVTSLKQFGPVSQHIILESVQYPFERTLTHPNKVPYYVNHETELTQWDHPEMTEILNSLSEKNGVRFSAYRTSLKLRLLQKLLKLELLELSKVLVELERATVTSNNSRQLTVSELVPHLISLLTTIDVNTDETSDPLNVQLYADLIVNWLLNVYDQTRTGRMLALSFAVAVVLMCKGHLEDKYRAVFQLVANADGLVSEHQLNRLLQECIQIPRQLGEIAAFGGSNVEPSVRSCFEKAGNRTEIQASHFVDWMKLEPQSMVWLPVMHRFAAAETARHQAKCSVCKEFPITGFRYRCLKCFHFDMCQNCFFSGRRSKSHKLSHPMQEYCTATTSAEDMRDFRKMFKNKFRTKRYFKKHPRLGYLPVQSDFDTATMERRSKLLVATYNAPTTAAAKAAGARDSRSSTASSTSLNVASRGLSGTSRSQSSSISHSKNAATAEMHLRMEVYANRLAHVEKTRRETTPDWEDEHNLIAQYCQCLHGCNSKQSLQSPMQIMMAVDTDQKVELEAMIKDLEEENRALQDEYDELRRALGEQNDARCDDDSAAAAETTTADIVQANGDVDLLAEARLLRQHKGRLEARMRVLEEHNEQLDSQLKRLRQLLHDCEQGSSSAADDARIITYPQTSPTDIPRTSSPSSLPRRGPPPSFTSSGRASSSTQPDGAASQAEQSAYNIAAEFHETMASEQNRAGETNASNMTDLLQVAGEVGKAVESLVTIMTDEEQRQNGEHGTSSQ